MTVLFTSHALATRWHRSWKGKSWIERFDLYKSEVRTKDIPAHRSFEQIDELMRVDFGELEQFDVDYEAIPFGYDRTGRGIYSSHHGKRFFLGRQQWMEDCKARLTFLTTESLVSRVLLRLHENLHKNISVLDLHPHSDLFPIDVPFATDKRAAADRGSNLKVTALAKAILAENPNATVIGDGIEGTDTRLINFQGVKGLNGFEERDITIIPTLLAPNKYVELNLLGQWLDLPHVIYTYHEDQISQLSGGIRAFEKPTRGPCLLSVHTDSEKRF